MQFADQRLSIETVFGPTEICITADALHVWWGDGVGPQDAAGLIKANFALIRQLATIKREAGEVEDNGVIRISELDVED